MRCWVIFRLIVVKQCFSPFVRYGIEQVEPKLIVTSQYLIPKLLQILSSFPNDINHIIYIEHPLKKNPLPEEHEMKTHQQDIIPFSKVELNGIVAKENKYTSEPGKIIISHHILNCRRI